MPCQELLYLFLHKFLSLGLCTFADEGKGITNARTILGCIRVWLNCYIIYLHTICKVYL